MSEAEQGSSSDDAEVVVAPTRLEAQLDLILDNLEGSAVYAPNFDNDKSKVDYIYRAKPCAISSELLGLSPRSVSSWDDIRSSENSPTGSEAIRAVFLAAS